MKLTVQALAEQLSGCVEGDGGLEITGVASISTAGLSDVTFAETPQSCVEASASGAGVILLALGAPKSSKTVIRVKNCRESFAQAMRIFHPPKCHPAGVHPSAQVASDARLGFNVCIGPNVVLESGVVIGDNSVVQANCVLGEGVTLGSDCVLHANVTLYAGIQVGNRVILHSGVTAGSDGFGYARKAGGHVKIPQIGRVIIEDDVEIGANTSIDRATMNATLIGAGTKIDNLVQIAHNVIIGRHCLIAGQCGIGGSSRLGDGVTLAGRVAVVDHVEIGANAVVGASSLVTKNVPAGVVVWGTPAQPARDAKRQVAALRRLPAKLRGLSKPCAGDTHDID